MDDLASNKKMNRSGRLHGGFSLLEYLVALAVIAVVIGIAVAALGSSIKKTNDVSIQQRKRIITDAIARAHLNGDTNAVLIGDPQIGQEQSLVLAVDYLLTQGYIHNP